jgi:multiple sugar transport system permease protein
MPDTSPVAVGINNYKLLLSLSDFRKALLNTLWYIIGMVPFSVIIPLILAIVTENLSNRAKNIYRALFFIPMIMPPVTVSTIWQWLFHPTNGLINHVLINLGIIDTGINFLNGSSKLRQTVTITLPLISPTVLFMMMLSILFTAQWTFAYINVLTQGGPGGATTNIYYLIYTYGMKSFNVGMSSAAAITFFILFGIISLIVTRINNHLEFYDN